METAKVLLQGKYIAINVYIKKHERSQISNLTLQLKELEKEQTKPTPKRKETIKIRAKSNK